MTDSVHIVIPAVGEAYKFYAKVTAESARRGSSLPVVIHYLDWKTFDRSKVESLGEWHGSEITWSRLWLPELYPDLDWVISADADIMFRGDVAELWRLRDDAYWALPSRDCPLPPQKFNEGAVEWYAERDLKFEDPKNYFCAGLTLFNLKAMRECGWSRIRDDFLQQFGHEPMPNADQCVLNYLMQGHVKLLPLGWGVFSGDENVDVDWTKAGAVHFVEDTPWNRYKLTHLESDLVVEWKKIANSIGGHFRWRNWRRLVFLLLKYNQWIVRLNKRIWVHFRNTRGVR